MANGEIKDTLLKWEWVKYSLYALVGAGVLLILTFALWHLGHYWWTYLTYPELDKELMKDGYTQSMRKSAIEKWEKPLFDHLCDRYGINYKIGKNGLLMYFKKEDNEKLARGMKRTKKVLIKNRFDEFYNPTKIAGMHNLLLVKETAPKKYRKTKLICQIFNKIGKLAIIEEGPEVTRKGLPGTSLDIKFDKFDFEEPALGLMEVISEVKDKFNTPEAFITLVEVNFHELKIRDQSSNIRDQKPRKRRFKSLWKIDMGDLEAEKRKKVKTKLENNKTLFEYQAAGSNYYLERAFKPLDEYSTSELNEYKSNRNKRLKLHRQQEKFEKIMDYLKGLNKRRSYLDYVKQ